MLQISSLSWPASQLANRKFHVSCSNRAAEISTLLEERILGASAKVSYMIYCLYFNFYFVYHLL